MSRGRLASLPLLGALSIALSARSAAAAPKLFVTLDYRVDASQEGCPDERAFRSMVESQLGYDPFSGGAADQLIARIVADDHGTRGALEWRDRAGALRGERELTSAAGACAELARTMSFAAAVQIQLLEREADAVEGAAPTSRPGASDARTRTPAATPPRRTAGHDDTPSRDGASVEAASPEFVVGVGPLVAFGVAPEPAIEARAFAAIRSGRLSFELGVESGLPSKHATADGDGVEQHVVTGGAAGCVAWSSLAACVVGKAGRLKVRGFGVDEPRSASGVVALVGPRLGFEHAGEHWFGALRIEALATLVPWRVELNQREVWSAPPLAFFVGADLAAIFQ